MLEEPLLSGELRARADLTLAAVLRALLVVLPLSAAANFALSGFSPVTWALILALPYIAALFLLQRRGHFIACVHAVVYGLIVMSIAVAALSGSVRSIGTMGVVAAITIGGVFLAHRSLMLAVGLSMALIGGLIYAENAGLLRAPNHSVTAAHWVMYSAVVVAVALVLSYVRSLLLDLVERLGASESRFRQVFESSPVGMTVTRVSDGRYVEANRADEHNLGYTREELLGRTTLEMGAWFSREDRQRFLATLRAQGAVEGAETRMRHRSGEIVECRIWARFAEIGGEQCVLASTINVTEKLRVERELQQDLRESERRYRSLFQAATDCILVISPEGTILDINHYGCRSLGYTREELVDGSFARILDETKLARLLPRSSRVKSERRSLRAEQEMRSKDGSLRTMEFTAGPLPDGNILVVARDVTERRRQDRELNAVLEQRVSERTEQLETANRDLESFSYSVSHDLRAPLRAIGGFSAMLREKDGERLSERGRALLRRVEDSSQRAAALIDALLEFSRLGRKPVAKIRVSMSQLVAEVLRELAAAPEAHRADVRIEALPDCPGDPILLKQVWQNLVANALKYSRNCDRPVVGIGCDAEGYFVRDNGVGFDMEYASKLFGVFERLHSPSEFEGTGIGLATAQRIVQRHGGTISATAEPGRGATFRFRLPDGS